MVTLEHILNYLDEANADATLLDNRGELAHIHTVRSFLQAAQPQSITDLEMVLKRSIDQAAGSQDSSSLDRLQQIAGYLMQPAELVGDRAAALRLRILAGQAANAREELEQAREV